MASKPTKRRLRTCPITGVLLSAVDEQWLSPDGRSVDVERLRERLPDCNAFGLPMIAGTIYTTGNVKPLKARLGFIPKAVAVPTSYYHLHQLPLGPDGEGPTLYATHVDSVTAGNSNYHVAITPSQTRGLRRGSN